MLFLLSIILVFSCTNDNEEELLGISNCDLGEIHFSEDVLPIIQNNCAIPTCHTSGSQSPDLSNYSSLTNNAQKIKIRINNGTMPPSTSGKMLTQEEKRKINCWIEEGTPNN